jgi:DnaJ-class molecular chaperone
MNRTKRDAKNDELKTYMLGSIYHCTRTGEEVKVEFEPYDFEASEQECETCGSHGEIVVTINKCPSCELPHRITIREW